MFGTVIDPQLLQPLLASLRLTERRPDPELIWISDSAARARIRPTGVDWTEGIPECLMALSYQMTTLEPETEAIGMWLPHLHTVHVVDAAMRSHLVSLGDKPALIPEAERTILARELRGLLGSVLARPGRMSTSDPIVIADDSARTDRLVQACAAAGQRIVQVLPQHAGQVWRHAGKVYVHQAVAADIAAAGLPPRADVTVLAAIPTPGLRQAAAALRTDEFLRWPAATRHIAASLKRHAQAQAVVRGELG